MKESQIVGSLLGTAIGDAIGLPYEGLSPRRASKLLGFPNRHRLLYCFGTISDDTEHNCLVVQSLIASGRNLSKFQQQLAWRLRFWLLGMPAGIGWATLRAIAKLWLGISPHKSGVFSAGNGSAMRSAILGVAIEDLASLRQAVQLSSRITHSDPKAEWGALAIALAARTACESSNVAGEDFLKRLTFFLGRDTEEFTHLIAQAVDSVNLGDNTIEFARKMGLDRGVSGYVYHCVPVAIHAWLSHQQDYREAIVSAVRCGGDTDSIAAMVGGIVGASVGKAGIPPEWMERLWEPSRSLGWMESLAKQLAKCLQTGRVEQPLRLSVPLLWLRNFFFLIVVVTHGFRRLLPPYST